MKSIIQSLSYEDYLSVLPAASRSFIYDTPKTEKDILRIAQYLAAEPASGLAIKGGVIWPRDLLPQIVREVHIFICTDDPKYAEYRQKLKSSGAPVAMAVVVLISNAISAFIDLAAGLLLPLVALILALAAKITVEAWCTQVAKEMQGASIVNDSATQGQPEATHQVTEQEPKRE
jgi:hypothetical protein